MSGILPPDILPRSQFPPLFFPGILSLRKYSSPRSLVPLPILRVIEYYFGEGMCDESLTDTVNIGRHFSTVAPKVF